MKKKKAAEPARGRRSPREPNELELLVARGVARVLDFADATLEVVERDPDRAVNAVVSGIEGVGKIGSFVKNEPERAKRVLAGLAMKGAERLSNAVIAASAKDLRKRLRETKK